MPYTRDDRRKIFAELPADLREAIISTETADKLQVIGAKHSLLIDQLGELGDELGLFMLGLTKQTDFVKNVARRLNIPVDKSIEITRDINTQIIDAIRSSLQKIQEKQPERQVEKQIEQAFQTPVPQPYTPPTPPPIPPQIPRPPVQRKPIYQNLPDKPPTPPPQPKVDLTSLERVGNFTIEERPASNSPQYNHTALSREDVLREIEDVDHMIGIKNEASFVDHLLSKPKPQPKEPPIGTPKYTKDPYREEF